MRITNRKIAKTACTVAVWLAIAAPSSNAATDKKHNSHRLKPVVVVFYGRLYDEGHRTILLGACAAEAVRAVKPAAAVGLGTASWPVAPLQAGESSPNPPRTADFSPRTLLPRRLLASNSSRTSHLPEGAKPNSADDFIFWRTMDDMAASAKEGIDSMIMLWPGKAVDVTRARGAAVKSIPGGPFTIGQSIRVSESEIRLSSRNELALVAIDIATDVCISLDSMKKRYPKAAISQPPHPNDPTERTYWSVLNANGKTSFAYEGSRPRCLASVVFNPSGD